MEHRTPHKSISAWLKNMQFMYDYRKNCKYFKTDRKSLINKHSGLVTKCRYRSKFKLRSLNHAGS